jgi:AraC-like DNA-binding protein
MSSPNVVRPTIPWRYVVELLAHAGDAAPALLAATGLPPEANSRGRFRVSVEQFATLYASATRASDDELFGLLARKVPRGTYAAILRLGTGSRRMGDFFESVARLYATFDRHRRPYAILASGGRATLRLPLHAPAQRRSLLFVHSILLTMWRSAAWLAGENITLRSFRLDPRFAAFAGEGTFLFGLAPEHLPGAAEIGFDAEWLRAPSRRSPADADVFVKRSVRAMLEAAASDTIETQVRAVLAADQPIASADLAAVAMRLHLSRSTLTRRLAAGGLSFQELKDALRRDHAIALLAGSQLGVAEVAERVGFSEASAFTRAFKAWTGVSPGRYRRT